MHFFVKNNEGILTNGSPLHLKIRRESSRDIPDRHKATYPKQGAGTGNSRYDVPRLLAAQSLWVEVGLYPPETWRVYLPKTQVLQDLFYDVLILDEGNDVHRFVAP